MTRPTWSCQRRLGRRSLSAASNVPDGIPDDVWQEIVAEEAPDDEGDDAMTDEQQHGAAEAEDAVQDDDL